MRQHRPHAHDNLFSRGDAFSRWEVVESCGRRQGMPGGRGSTATARAQVRKVRKQAPLLNAHLDARRRRLIVCLLLLLLLRRLRLHGRWRLRGHRSRVQRRVRRLLLRRAAHARGLPPRPRCAPRG